MTNPRVSKLEQALQNLVDLGGIAETTTIVPNAEVINAAPADLPAGYIIVENELGYYVPAVLVAGLTVSNGDFVNLLYIKGTEIIAFQHGSGSGGGSTGGNVWPKGGQFLLEGVNYSTATLLIAAMAPGSIGYIGANSSLEAIDVNVQDITLQGVGRIITRFVSTFTVSDVLNGSRIEDIGIIVDGSGSQAILITDGPVDFVDVLAEHVNVEDARGFQLEANARLYDCEGIADSDGSGTPTARAVYVTNSATVEIHGGNFIATTGTADEIFVDSGAFVLLDGPTLAFGNFGGAGDAAGWYLDSVGGVHFVSYTGTVLKEWQFNSSGNLVSTANSKLILGNGATEAPLSITERNTEPSSPGQEDIYLDDGTNTASGDPGFRRYDGAAWEDIGGGGSGSGGVSVKNLLYHSLTHDLWSEGTSFSDIADDTYVADLWNVLHNGQAPDISGQANSAGDPFKRSFRCTFDSASSQAGIVQFLETEDTYPLQVSPVVSLSFDAWGNSGVTALRAAVLYWTGVPDALTSDVVGTWATGNQTLATDWNYANTPAADITITTTRTRYKVENITIPSTADNIAVFIWTPNAQASGNLWNVVNVQLERGPVATEFVARSFNEELVGVQHFVKAFAGAAGAYWTRPAFRQGAQIVRWKLPLSTTMRTVPSLSHNVTAWDDDGTPETTEIAAWNWTTDAAVTITGALGTPNFAEGDRDDLGAYITAGTSFSGTSGTLCDIRLGPDAVIIASARL